LRPQDDPTLPWCLPTDPRPTIAFPGLCEHPFVTAQGSALTRYRRALERRHIFGAEIAAKEMAYVSLRDALGLLALYASEDSPKYDRAAMRWLGRLALEADDLSLPDLQSVAAALHALRRRPDAALLVLQDLSRDGSRRLVR
jgi:hypothetical protein